MLKTTRLSVASAFRVDENEIVSSGGGAGAESGRSLIKQKLSPIIYNYPEYPKDKKDFHAFFRPQKAGLIAEEALTKVPVKYANFAFSLDLASKLPKPTGINNHSIKLVDGYLSYL